MKLLKLEWNMHIIPEKGYHTKTIYSCDCPTKHGYVAIPHNYKNKWNKFKVVKRTRAIWLFGVKIK